MIRFVQHKATLHHWRHDRKHSFRLFMCTCGWKPRWARTKKKYYVKRVKCLLTSHQFDEWEDATVGPAGAPDEEFVSIGQSRICDFCLKVENREPR